jgi:hypothetical protein
LGKTFEYLKNGDHVGRLRGEDLVAIVVQDELVFEVSGPRWRWTPPSNPRIAALGVFEIFFGCARCWSSSPVKDSESSKTTEIWHRPSGLLRLGGRVKTTI